MYSEIAVSFKDLYAESVDMYIDAVEGCIGLSLFVVKTGENKMHYLSERWGYRNPTAHSHTEERWKHINVSQAVEKVSRNKVITYKKKIFYYTHTQ